LGGTSDQKFYTGQVALLPLLPFQKTVVIGNFIFIICFLASVELNLLLGGRGVMFKKNTTPEIIQASKKMGERKG
jgi:hypothetical protein